MTDDHKELFRRRSSSREFLISKTNTKPQDLKSSDSTSVVLDELYPAFAEILSGQAFIEHAMVELENSAGFSAMIVRIDDTGENKPIPGLRFDIAQIIDSVCQSHRGIWGQLEPDLLGCCFPEHDGTSSQKLAQDIQSRLAKQRQQTVTIGIADYPTLDFQKHQIIDNARKAIDHAAFFGPGSLVLFDAVSLNISGDTYYQTGDVDQAIHEFETALRLDPNNVNVRNSLGVCFGVLGKYDQARTEFETAVQINPDEIMAIYNIGLIYLLTGDKKKALEQFLKADRVEEEIFEVAFQIGKLYLEMEDPEQSKPLLQKAAKLKPESGTTHRYLGDCCMQLNLIDEAVAAYKKAIRQNPNDAHSLSAIGYLFDLRGENPEITTIFCQQSVDISPDNGLFRHRLGSLYLKRNQLKDALEQFQKAEELGFDSKALIQKIENLMRIEAQRES